MRLVQRNNFCDTFAWYKNLVKISFVFIVLGRKENIERKIVTTTEKYELKSVNVKSSLKKTLFTQILIIATRVYVRTNDYTSV